MKRLRAANPGKVVEVWAEDEARLGLKPITRRVWWLKGCRPGSCGRTKEASKNKIRFSVSFQWPEELSQWSACYG